MDPAICDSSLHLSAIPNFGKSLAEGVPVSCQAVVMPKRSRPEFGQGAASAIPGDLKWTSQPEANGMTAVGLVSKVIGAPGRVAAIQSSAARQVSYSMPYLPPWGTLSVMSG